MPQQVIVTPSVPGEALAQTNQAKAIELVQAQIADVKKEITDLRAELVPGTTDARESAVNEQISAASERLQSLQGQLDRMVSGVPMESEMRPPPEFMGNGNDIPHGVQTLLENGMVAVVLIVLGYPIIRLITRRLEPRPKPEPAADQTPRLDRLEQAMDAVAIEVERISEGQRFTNKLLGEMRALPAPNPLDQWAGARPKVEEKVERR